MMCSLTFDQGKMYVYEIFTKYTRNIYAVICLQ